MEIERKENDFNSYDYCLTDGNKKLTILFARCLDLYIMINDDQFMKYAEAKTIHFDITKADYDIFRLFDSLYQDIINCKVFDLHDVRNTCRYEYEKLVDDKQCITWISDDDREEIGDRFTLSKLNDDVYRLIFYRNDKIPDFGFKNPMYISVRIRNSGSRYKPFNCVFMKMYHELQDIDPNFRQIHLEELQYIKKCSLI